MLKNKISISENTEFDITKNHFEINDFKNKHLLSTSEKDDSIKIFENNNFNVPQNTKDAIILQHHIETIENPSIQHIINSKNKKKIFNIFKFKREIINNEFDKSISSEAESDFENLRLNLDNGDNRILANSKVNFSKLSDQEKDHRLKNLAKLVKRLRRKTRNLEQKLKKNANKILNRYLSKYLGIKKYKPNNIPLKL